MFLNIEFKYLDAIASVGLHMSVGRSVGVPIDDGTSVNYFVYS